MDGELTQIRPRIALFSWVLTLLQSAQQNRAQFQQNIFLSLDVSFESTTPRWPQLQHEPGNSERVESNISK